ncbi:MAG: ribose 5-phosphate isomerase B [Oscillospiraceae bacterium]|jgi:ribose 5-phosphate isomerase B|nr:ribose 5-phosphate isomerase B [Oscillospiraceae bacterium]
MIAMGSDHGGYRLKEAVKLHLEKKGIDCKDFGAYGEESCDYPLMAQAPCKAVVAGECELALLFCGTGIGISMAANKHKGIRAAVCSDIFSARMARLHNNANVLCMGGRVVGEGLALDIVDAFLNSSFEGGRHARRVGQVDALDA